MLLSLTGEMFRGRRKSLLRWGAGLSLMLVVGLALFPWLSQLDWIDEALDLFDLAPTGDQGNSILNAAGLVMGFLLPAYLVVFGCSEGSRLFTDQDERRNLVWILSYPLARWKALAGRLLFLLLALAALTLGGVLILVLGLLLEVAHPAVSTFLAWSGQIFLVALFFSLLAVLSGDLSGKVWIGRSAGLGLFLLGGILFVLARLERLPGWLDWGTPFHFTLLPAVPDAGTAIRQAAALAMGIVVLALAVWMNFERLDLD
jgi:ABC-type transport system involved in multi-copper enzyme maturation permease subunit